MGLIFNTIQPHYFYEFQCLHQFGLSILAENNIDDLELLWKMNHDPVH